MNRARSWPVEPSHKIQQSGFAGAGTAEQCQKFAGWHGQRYVVHGANRRFAHQVVAGGMIHLNSGLRGFVDLRCADGHSFALQNTNYGRWEKMWRLMLRSCGEVL